MLASRSLVARQPNAHFALDPNRYSFLCSLVELYLCPLAVVDWSAIVHLSCLCPPTAALLRPKFRSTEFIPISPKFAFIGHWCWFQCPSGLFWGRWKVLADRTDNEDRVIQASSDHRLFKIFMDCCYSKATLACVASSVTLVLSPHL